MTAHEAMTVASLSAYVGAVAFAADLRILEIIDRTKSEACAVICFCVGAILQITVVVQ